MKQVRNLSQVFNKKSISRNITHRQSYILFKDWRCVVLREVDFLFKNLQQILFHLWSEVTWNVYRWCLVWT